MIENDDLIHEFLVESYENLEQVDRDLVDLERDAGSAEIMNRIFRAVHTIKGTCGFLGFGRLETLAHSGENLLGRLRDGLLQTTPEIVSALLRTVDVVRKMLQTIEATRAEGEFDTVELVAELKRLQEPPRSDAPPEPEPAPRPVQRGAAPLAADEARALLAHEIQQQEHARVQQSVADRSVRVDVGLLDGMMNLVEELVLTRNQMLQLTSRTGDKVLVSTGQRLNLITSELQERMLKTRMLPIQQVLSKFPRVVRDVALACGKKCRVVTEGAETELDKTIVEAIKDPLTHLVRNAVDHGLELPDARRAAGKNPEGEVRLAASQEGGQVTIEVRDDGGGIDHLKLRQKAVAKGLIAAAQADRMTESEALNLIFLPGFSTAEKVTNVSGRGVGMDVVRTNIEKIGGTIEIKTRVGEGTTIRIRIPLTLAIVPALIVTCAGARYAVPQGSLVELIRLRGDRAKNDVALFHDAPVCRLRGRLLPLVPLREALGEPPDDQAAGAPAYNIVVIDAGGRRFGLTVDGIQETAEIVVRPLSHLFEGLDVFSGATILGDGRVALILDAGGLAQHAKLSIAEADAAAHAQEEAADGAAGERQQLLIVQAGTQRRVAIPCDRVVRLERFARADVEQAGARAVLPYRGTLLPLIHLAPHLDGDDGTAVGLPDPMRTLICSEGGRLVGLVAERVLDMVDTKLVVDTTSRSAALAGSAMVQDKVTDIVDIPGLLRTVDPGLFETAQGSQFEFEHEHELAGV